MNDRLDEIFEAQASLLRKAHPIELSNIPTMYAEVPIDIDDPNGQLRIKEFAWRITEEVAETLDLARKIGFNNASVQEEISDIFHFLVELYLSLGWAYFSFEDRNPLDNECRLLRLYKQSSDPLKVGPAEQFTAWLDFLISLGMWMNGLKNRPWKIRYQATNVRHFNQDGIAVMVSFIYACKICDFGPVNLHAAYMAKNEVNHRRLEPV